MLEIATTAPRTEGFLHAVATAKNMEYLLDAPVQIALDARPILLTNTDGSDIQLDAGAYHLTFTMPAGADREKLRTALQDVSLLGGVKCIITQTEGNESPGSDGVEDIPPSLDAYLPLEQFDDLTPEGRDAKVARFLGRVDEALYKKFGAKAVTALAHTLQQEASFTHPRVLADALKIVAAENGLEVRPRRPARSHMDVVKWLRDERKAQGLDGSG